MNRTIIAALMVILVAGCGMPAVHPIESTAVADKPVAVNPTIEEVWVCAVNDVSYTGVVRFCDGLTPMVDLNGDEYACMFHVVSEGPPMSIAETEGESLPYALNVRTTGDEAVTMQLPGTLSELTKSYYLLVDEQGRKIASLFRSKRWMPSRPQPPPATGDAESVLARLKRIEAQLPLLRNDWQNTQADLAVYDEFIRGANEQLTRLRTAEKNKSDEVTELNKRLEQLNTVLQEAPPLIERLTTSIPQLAEVMLKAADKAADLRESLKDPELDEFYRQQYGEMIKLNDFIVVGTLQQFDRAKEQKKDAEEMVQVAKEESPKIAEKLPALEDNLVVLRSRLRLAEDIVSAMQPDRERLVANCDNASRNYHQLYRSHDELTEVYNRQRRAESEAQKRQNTASAASVSDPEDQKTVSPRFTARLTSGVRIGWKGEVDLYQGLRKIGHFPCRIEGAMPASVGTTDPLMDGSTWILVVDSHDNCLLPEILLRHLDPSEPTLPIRIREREGERKWLIQIVRIRE